MRVNNLWIIFGTILLFSMGAHPQGGTLSGKITYEGDAPEPQILKITKDKRACGKEPHYDESLLVSDDKGIRNVVVTIKNAPKGDDFSALGNEFAIHQIGCVYTPHVVLIPVNTELVIYNDDGILHNLHTYSEKNPPFNISQPKYKKKIKKKFKEPEIITIKCDVHGWMTGYIVVVDHPYVALSNATGEYTISNIPPGTYQVEFWHEKLGTVQKEVTIGAGATTSLDVTYPAQ